MRKDKILTQPEEGTSAWSWLNTRLGVVITLGTIISYMAYTIVRVEIFAFNVNEVKDDVIEVKNNLAEFKSQVKEDLGHTNDLLNADFTYRYMYSYHPVLKRRIPVYDPVKQRLEFVDIDSVSKK